MCESGAPLPGAPIHMHTQHSDPPSLTDDARPRIARGFRLQWEAAQDSHVLLYPEGMVKLNPSASEILQRCDGAHTFTQIVAELEQRFDATALRADIAAFLNMAHTRHWVDWPSAPSAPSAP
jgi:pyrroloquinoline quinone biosynthesis protein D